MQSARCPTEAPVLTGVSKSRKRLRSQEAECLQLVIDSRTQSKSKRSRLTKAVGGLDEDEHLALGAELGEKGPQRVDEARLEAQRRNDIRPTKINSSLRTYYWSKRNPQRITSI
jgi:hypothetical protein